MRHVMSDSGVTLARSCAGKALDREILIHGPDEMVLGFEQHLVVGIVRDSAPGGECRQSRATSAAQHAIPEQPLDVLAQQIVAEVAAREYGEDELYALMRTPS
jgi:hypothetical protein